MRPAFVLALGLAAVGALAGACSDGDTPTGPQPGGSSAGGAAGFVPTGGEQPTGGSGGACAESTHTALPLPVNMFITFDRSASMNGSKWTASTQALTAFFEAPESAGSSVALRFFPHDGCDESCQLAPCEEPLVPLGTLSADPAPADAQEQLLVAALEQLSPAGGTPMSVALEGALGWAREHASLHPEERTVVVLVTDGAPSDCELDHDYLVGLPESALTSSSVLTFAIGLDGADTALVDDLAAAGGTKHGIFVGTEDAEKQLLAALQSVTVSSVACRFEVPESQGKPADPDKVNVKYTPGEGEPTTIGKVATEKACGPDGGWYYEPEQGPPSSIVFCPATCASVQGDADASVDIILGCATVLR
jgi:hypothetical protein